jgi:hypothetical protein
MASINVNNLPAKAAAAITTADAVMTFTASGDTTQTPFSEAVAQANTLNANAALTIASITIPTAQVLTLNATPVAFGITVPVGYIPVIVGEVLLSATYGAATYATNTALRIRSVGGSVDLVVTGAALAFGATVIRSLDIQNNSTGLRYVDGADLEVYVPSGNPTTGDSDITITLTYILLPTP